MKRFDNNGRKLRKHIRSVRRDFGAAVRQLSDTSGGGAAPYGAAEWLLDNDYVIAAGLLHVEESLPPHFVRELPEGADGTPGVYSLAREYWDAAGELDVSRLSGFVEQYQAETALSIGELWALPAFLRLVVAEDLLAAAQEAVRIAGTGFSDVRDSAPDSASAAPSPSGAPSSSGAPPSSAAERGQRIVDALDERVGACVTALRGLDAADWATFVETVGLVDRVLRRDPSGAYTEMEFATRDDYRKAVERMARAAGLAEVEVAERAIRLARSGADPRSRHVGTYLVAEGAATLESTLRGEPAGASQRRPLRRRWATGIYLGAIAIGTLLTLTLPVAYVEALGTGTGASILVALIAAVPATGLAVAIVNRAITMAVHPRLLPKLDFSEGIAPDWRVVVAVPALLERDELDGLMLAMEMSYLGNDDPALSYVLLADPPDASEEMVPGDDDVLAHAVAGVDELNRRYERATDLDQGAAASPFLLIVRGRSWNPVDKVWMGWERKRGKLEELNRMLLGGDSSLRVAAGDARRLAGIRAVITLDADTNMPAGAAARLAGTLAHPLNRPVFEDRGGRGKVVRGYTVIQPRVETTPASAGATMFARVYSGNTALDLYTHAVSDVYQDLFHEGVYTGKGIYDLDGFHRSLEGAVPANAILSHDLFEGLHGRVALASDIVVYEDYPAGVIDYMRRLHRWVRGDWQLTPWLLPRVPSEQGSRPNTFWHIGRWKILDNLRRTLIPPSVLGLLVAGWTVLPGSPWLWTLLGLGVVASPVLLAPITAAQRIAGGTRWAAAGHDALFSIRDTLVRVLLDTALLPYESAVILDAVSRTLYRLAVTRRGLLEWTTASRTRRLVGWAGGAAVWREMATAVVIAVAAALLVTWARPEALLAAAPFIFAWALSPEIAIRVSRRTFDPPAHLPAASVRELRRIARKTWLYFERHAGPEGNWLAPDHYQEEPLDVVARRTSPTNIGLGFLSTLAAYDRGYTTLLDCTRRLQGGLATLERMERRWGHFFNWYDSRDLTPLEPRYISTVDSGNLAGSLIALAEGVSDIPDEPLSSARARSGLLDTLDVLRELLRHVGPRAVGSGRHRIQWRLDSARRLLSAEPENIEEWGKWLAQLEHAVIPYVELRALRLVEASGTDGALPPAEIRTWLGRLRHEVQSARRDIDLLAPWARFLGDPPTLPDGAARALREMRSLSSERHSLRDLPHVARRMTALLEQVTARSSPGHWSSAFSAALDEAKTTSLELIQSLDQIADDARMLADEMDFRFLFDPARKLFRIGYNVSDDLPDPNHYDLLASEARLASFVAIAKGEVPESHWLHLGRPYGRIGGAAALLSWGATAFEYLMPRLLMFHPRGSLMDVSCRAAVDAHRAFGSRNALPWGISESAFHSFDVSGEYQYRSFGVPGLGLKRELGDRLVIAPYASFLALPYAPEEVLDNVHRLRQAGAEGPYGFYDAVDYGDAEASERHAHVVRTYMSHHQAMLLLAVHNYLSDDIMVRRFHNVPQILAAERLLWEQRPRRAPSVTAWRRGQRQRPRSIAVPVMRSWDVPIDTTVPQVHLLTAGKIASLVSARGGGTLTWNGLSVLAPDFDPVTENVGCWIYVRDRDSGRIWSAASEPLPGGSIPSVRFSPAEATFHRSEDGIATYMSVAVVADPDAEIRTLRVANESDIGRKLTVTSFGELALDDGAAFARHPAFSRLFLISETAPDQDGVIFHRRWREPDRVDDPHVLHRLVRPVDGGAQVRFETDRAAFVGRGRTAANPAALAGSSPSGSVGAVLDPCLALETDIELEPAESVTLTFVTIAARSRTAAIAAGARLDSPARVGRALDQTRRAMAAEQQRLGLSGSDMRLAQQLLSAVLSNGVEHRARFAVLASTHAGQRGLWPLGISGDLPIVVVNVADADHAGLAHLAVRAHGLWRGKGPEIDLVIVDATPDSYERPIQDRLAGVIADTGASEWLHRRGGIFVVQRSRLAAEEIRALEAAARVVLDASGNTLEADLARGLLPPSRLPAFVPIPATGRKDPPTPPLPRPEGLAFDNGYGGFTPDGREYVIWLEPGRTVPAPWSHVLANPDFGCLITERGFGSTWAVNSAERRLTPWRNDPVSDPPSEALYLRDEETGSIWTSTASPQGAPAPYEIRYGAGYAKVRHSSHGLLQELSIYVHPDEPVKYIRLKLENLRDRPRRITATYYAEWVLGARQSQSAPFVVPEFDHETQTLLARNPFRTEFAERVAFVTSSERPHGVTSDRREFLGVGRGSASGPPPTAYATPAGLVHIGLSGRVEPGQDPCAAFQVHVDMAARETKVIHFALGDGRDRADAVALARAASSAHAADDAWEKTIEFWDTTLGAVQVTTPDPALDLMINRWLPYQTLACRIWGRSAMYQSSGAFGFRDQLQDVSALLWLREDLAREHLLRAAAHQFAEGDVLHWWHPPTEAGVRTKISDDLLWLPYTVARYVRWTGDRTVLDEEVPYLSGPAVGSGGDLFGQFDSAGSGTLRDHCLRAIERGVTAGKHGLPLFGSGDWNDGMNRVGANGEGESVWLAWFSVVVLTSFAETLEPDDGDLARSLRSRADTIRAATEQAAWDGDWYIRGTFDDGSPLGSARSPEAQIDAIAQAWSVFAHAERSRTERAMESARRSLLRPDEQVLLLLAPPFSHGRPDPGYIASYPPGVRENGGQYTHAAAWVGMATAMLGQHDRAFELFEMLSPVRRTSTPVGVARYRGEPYAIAADVQGTAPHEGRAGWTWYTGAAGWMYQLGLETILGLSRKGGRLVVEPRLPSGWPGYEARIRSGGAAGTTETLWIEPPLAVQNRTALESPGDGAAATAAPERTS